jgi:hypothetical protein
MVSIFRKRNFEHFYGSGRLEVSPIRDLPDDLAHPPDNPIYGFHPALVSCWSAWRAKLKS